MWASAHTVRGHAPLENFEFYIEIDSGTIWVCNTMHYPYYFVTRKHKKANLTQELDRGWSSSSWPVNLDTSVAND